MIVAASLSNMGCKKTAEQETLDAYISRMGLTGSVQSHPAGFYYKIVSPGSGQAPAANSRITIYYKGTLPNGNVFDQTGTPANYQSGNPVTFSLNQLIPGWQVGLPLIKPGGTIILYLPPNLGYGAQGAGSIPPNSVLIFEITLVSVG